MIVGSSPISSIATAEVAHWLRGVLAAVLDAPGDLYNPIYVGPLPSGGPLAGVLREAAADRKLDVVESAVPPAAGVWLAGVAEAEAALADGVTPRPGVQWVIWSAAASSALPDRLAGWLGATGLAIDPFAGAAGSVGAWSMYPAVKSVVTEADAGLRRFVVVVGDDHDLGSLAAELQLHLELELEESVWRGPVDGWRVGDGSRSARVLVVTRGTDLAGLCARLASVQADSGPWGLVLDAASADGLSGLREWEALSAGCVWLRHTAQEMAIHEDVFPPVCDLLVGSGGARSPDGIAQFDLGAVSLPEILQSAEGWARCGTLIIFGADRAGYVRVGRGRVSAAGFYGCDAPSARPDEPAIHDVLCALSSWVGAAGVFVPGDVENGGVPIGRVVMALAHAAPEKRSPYNFLPALRPHEVAEVLLGWGLADVASAYLRRAEVASAWGPEEDVLLGSISAVQEPEAASARLRHGALRAFSERGPEGGTELYVNGMLNALLVEVRGGHTVPAVAWSIVNGWLRDAGSSWATTARHAAIWMELALRAGARESAVAAQERLRDFADDSSRWTRLLGVRFTGEAGHG